MNVKTLLLKKASVIKWRETRDRWLSSLPFHCVVCSKRHSFSQLLPHTLPLRSRSLILFLIIVMQNIEIVAVIICLFFAGLHKKP